MSDSNEINPDGFSEHEADKGSDGCKPKIARAGGIATGCFQIIQERQDGIWAQRIKRQLVNGPAMAAREKRQQQSEGVAVTTSGVHAEVPLGNQIMGKETLYQVGQFITLHNFGYGNGGIVRSRPAMPSGRWRHTTRSS